MGDALEASAVISLPDLNIAHSFLVEKLWNGSLCLWEVAEEGNTLLGHLRLRPDGAIDCKGGRGKWAQFRATSPSPAVEDKELVELQNVGTGFWLSNDTTKPCASAPQLLRIRQVQPPGSVTMNMPAKVGRRREEAKLYMLSR